MSEGTTALMSAQWMSSAKDAQVWTRSARSGPNIVVMTDDLIAYGILPKDQLGTARQRLQDGEPLLNVLGPRSRQIHFLAIRSISAKLNSTDLLVEHAKRGDSVEKCIIPMPDKEAQANAIAEVRDRIKKETEIFEQKENRWLYAMKPFNCLVVCLLLSWGAYSGFQHDLFTPGALRKYIEDDNQPERRNQETVMGRAGRRATQHATARTIAHTPILSRLLIFGIIILGVVATILNAVGFHFTMAVLLGASGACFLWALARLFNPPRQLTVVVAPTG